MGDAPDIRSIETVLREAGLTRRQAKALLAGGWRALVGEARAEADELKLELDLLRSQLSTGTINPSTPAA